MKIGIIGAENSHTAAIATLINVEKKVKGFTVEYVWGETAEYAQKAAQTGQIPHIVKSPREMLGKIDALIVDHRHAKFHLKAALPFVKKGIPAFIDKPFCYRAAEGIAFLKAAKAAGAPVTSFSVVPEQASFQKFTKQLAGIGKITAGVTYGPADLKSQWGGIFFYGIHQVDMALNAFGYNVEKILITKNGNGATGQLLYDDGKIVVMHLIQEGCGGGFCIGAMGEKGQLYTPIVYDKLTYLNGVKTFTAMFKTKVEPVKYEHMLMPVQVLEAMEKSVKSGKMEKVAKVKI